MRNTTRTLFYFCTSLLFFGAKAYAEFEEKDIEALRQWVNTKRQVTVNEKGGSLSISGEVRSEMQASYEKRNGVSQRGARTPFHVPHATYDVEVNLMFDYRTDRTWGSVKLEFDNNAGVFNGTLSKIKLERAYFGGRYVKTEDMTMDFEIGRRRIVTIVDSKLQGDSFFDGIFARWDQDFEHIAKAYVHAGVFLIDELRSQYGYLGELGLLDIADSGFYTKYLLIDWHTKNLHNDLNNLRFRFLTNQLLLGYKFIPSKLNKLVVIYVGGLVNPIAKQLKITNHKRANWGGYAGFSIGELKKAGDWAMDANYQVVQAQAVPQFDATGIGTGNASGGGFYTVNFNGTGAPTTRRTAGGSGTNFQGYTITLEYLITNNLVIFQSWAQSHSLDSSIGPTQRFKQYEIEFNYGF